VIQRALFHALNGRKNMSQEMQFYYPVKRPAAAFGSFIVIGPNGGAQ
jgi:hypothetical protein